MPDNNDNSQPIVKDGSLSDFLHNTNKVGAQPLVVDTSAHLEDITKTLYGKNAELAVKNKALSLLGTLYQISILTLKPEELGKKICYEIRRALNFEFVGVFLYDEVNDRVQEHGIAESDRFHKEIASLGYSFEGLIIQEVSKTDFFESVFTERKTHATEEFDYAFKTVFPENVLDTLIKNSHLKGTIILPLAIESRVLGFIVMSLNREFEQMNDSEQDTVRNVTNVVSVAFDKSLLYEEVSEANEKLKSLDKLKTEFVSLASHQLRSPLTAIKGYTSMLLEGSYGEIGSPDQKMAIDRVFQSSVGLAQVIEDLLDVSKIEQGGMKFEMADMDIVAIAKNLVDELQISAKNKNLSLQFESNAPTAIISGDSVKLRQVVLNYVDNALKYTPSGTVRVSVKSDVATKKVRIAITDSGMGIPPEIMSKLFKKFERGEGGKVNAGGSGLGLYLAKEIVEAHKGKTWAESPGRGKGSTFFVELDLK